MRIENSFSVPLPRTEAMSVLTDVPTVAPCLPGVAVTGRSGERAYTGEAKVRLGPVSLIFAGEAEIKEIDSDNGRATLHAKGNDTKGRGGAEADVVFTLHEENDGETRVDIATDLALSGSVAQYGRASGLIAEVANQLTAQFADNLRARLAERKGASKPASTVSAAPVSGIRLLLLSVIAIFRRWLGRARNAR